MSDTEAGLQHLLNIVGRFGAQRRLQFSPEKSKVIVNWRKPICKRGWSLGGIDIKEYKLMRLGSISILEYS